MQFTITQAGLLAAQNAQAGGPKITITSFRVGSAYNYLPSIGDTALRGTTLHTQLINGYSVLSANEVEYTLILNEEIGNFSFGEVGLYLEDGTLFSLGSLDALQPKTKSGQTDSGNIISIDARLVLSQLAANISFPINAMPNARMLETPSVDMLKPPSISDTNAYLTMSRDSGGSSIPAFKSGDFDWGFPSFSRTITSTVTSNGKNYTTATVTFTGGSPTRSAVAQATIVGGVVQALVLTDAGAGYTSIPTIVIGGDGIGAEATATIAQGVTALNIVNGGAGYSSAPSVLISGGGGTGATATASITAGVVTGLTITNPGSGYTSNPTVTLSGGGGGAATATAAISGVVNSLKVNTNSTNSMLCAELSGLAADPISGKYIVEFLSGPLAGYCRMVTASSAFSLNWSQSSPTGSAPLPGAQFALWQSNASLLGTERNTQPPAYLITSAYKAGKVVSYLQQLWRCTTDTPSGSFNPAHWTRILGTAAAVNIQASQGDTTAGSALTPGAFGLGGDSIIAADLNAIEVGGLYSIGAGTTNVPVLSPVIGINSQVLHMSYNAGASRYETQLLIDRGQDRVLFRRCVANVWQPFMPLANNTSPALTGTPTAPTAAAGTNTTQLATTAFVAALGALKANLASPALTGTPTAPTADSAVNNTQIATTAFVQAVVSNLIAGAPGALDTLKELADAMGDDPNFAATMTNQLSLKAPLDSPVLTGNPTTPNQASGDNDTSIANTAFVQGAVNGAATVSIAGTGTATLTAAQYGVAIIILTGALTGAKTVVVPTASGQWIFINNTTGAFTTTVKTAAGTGIVVTQGTSSELMCDGTNVRLTQTDFISPALTGTPTAPTAAAGTSNTQIASTAFVQAAMAVYNIGSLATAPLTLAVNLDWAKPAGWSGFINVTASKANGVTVPLDSGGGNPSYGMWVITGRRDNSSGYTGLFIDYSNGRTWTGYAAVGSTGPTFTEMLQINSPTMLGVPTAPTAAAGTNTNQLATMAALMAGMDQFGLGSVNSTDIADCNSVPNTGFYRLQGTAANSPYPNATCSLINVRFNATGCWQLVSGVSNNIANARMFWRTCAGGTWSGWKEFSPLDSPALTGTPTAPTQTTGDSSTKIANTAYVTSRSNGILTKSVAGAANVTLTADEAGVAVLWFTGAITADISVILPASTGLWTVFNRTTGNFNLTIKTSGGTGVQVGQNTQAQVVCGGLNMYIGAGDVLSPQLTGTPTAPSPANANVTGTQIANLDFVRANARKFYSGGIGIATATATLSAADAGRWWNITGANAVITLPASSTLDAGETFLIRNMSAGPITVTSTSNISTEVTSTTLTMARYEIVEIVGNGTSYWVTQRSAVQSLAPINNPLFSGEVQSAGANSYRQISGNYGNFWRNDGASLYLMMTNSGDQYGAFNALRPFTVNLATGKVALSQGVTTLTMPVGTNTLDVATTAFVQAASRSYLSSGSNVTVSTTLTAAQCGGWTNIFATGITITLPHPSTIVDGQTYQLKNFATGAVTLAITGGALFFVTAAVSGGQATISLDTNEWAEVTSRGTGWNITARGTVDVPVSKSYVDSKAITQRFTASGSWTCPDNVTLIFVSGCGGGGGGGGGGGNNTLVAGGGGGGGAAAFDLWRPLVVVPGTVYTVTIGTRGSAGAAGVASANSTSTSQNGGSGGTGGATSLGSLVTFAGGTGGGGGGGSTNSGAGGIGGNFGGQSGTDGIPNGTSANTQVAGNGGVGGGCPFGTAGGGGRGGSGGGVVSTNANGYGTGGGGGGGGYGASAGSGNGAAGGQGSPGFLAISY